MEAGKAWVMMVNGIRPRAWLHRMGMVLLGFLVIGGSGCFRIGADAQALRDSVMRSARGEWDETIEIGVGGVTLGLARAGLGFVRVEEEAEAALSALRGVQVGVYSRRDGSARLGLDVNRILMAADQAMERRGWDRVVGVMQSGEVVAVYVPKDVRSTRDVRLCVAVMRQDELVIGSARSDLEPLLELALAQGDWGKRASMEIR